MDSTETDDTWQTTVPASEHVNGTSGHPKSHSRHNSVGSTKEMDLPISGKNHTEKNPVIEKFEKLKGLFRSRSSAGSKGTSPQIKISMHPEGQEDKKMSQKGSRSTKLTLDSHEADGESDTDFEVPSDGNLYTYSVDNMMQFFKYMNFDEKIVKSLQRRKVDGRRFAKMTDEDFKKYGIDNPIVMYFRSKCEKKRESANLFML